MATSFPKPLLHHHMAYLQVKELRHSKRTFPKVIEQPACKRIQSTVPGSSSSKSLDRADPALCLDRPRPLTVAPFGPVIPWGP